MNKTIIYAIVAMILLSACAGNEGNEEYRMKNEESAYAIGSQPNNSSFSILHSPFKEEVRLKTTPVKHQGQSSWCWIYAMLATIETEHLMQGDSVNLSADYLARMWLSRATRDSYFGRGEKAVNMRGVAPMALRLLEECGAEPWSSFHQKGTVNYHVLCKKLTQMAQNASARHLGLRKMEADIDVLLDDEIDFLPRFVFMAGAEYTPREFGHSVCLPGEYEALTSFSHHPYGEEFVLEIPDNQTRERARNVPLEVMMHRIDESIRKGHPVCWEGDISERGFSFAYGIGKLTRKQIQELAQAKDTMDLRQRELEQFRTTDDHCMELMGIARDSQGCKYYIAKNSWGDQNPYGGYMYVSEDYVRMKTILVVVKNE